MTTTPTNPGPPNPGPPSAAATRPDAGPPPSPAVGAPGGRRRRAWYDRSAVVGLAELTLLRSQMVRHNLFDAYSAAERAWQRTTDLAPHRSYDGSGCDPEDRTMGRAGTRFGRNMPPSHAVLETGAQLLTPSPREVSRHLLTRQAFRPSDRLNMLAAAWLQFQVHGWVSHGDAVTQDPIELGLADGDPWPSCPMRIRRTPQDPAPSLEPGAPAGFANHVSHWWDGSQIYGADEARCRELRSGENGKLSTERGRLPDETAPGLAGIDRTGFSDNYWLGLSLLHTLFVKEHNSVCDRLKASYPTWDDERTFHTARLVTTAVMARIHLTEWTPGIIDCPAQHLASSVVARGGLPRWLSSRARHGGFVARSVELTGALGSAIDHEGVPFSLTEEFAYCYRLHPMLRDDYPLRSHRDGRAIETLSFDALQGLRTREVTDAFGTTDLLYSFGTMPCGDNSLHNHPSSLAHLTRLDGETVDVGTLDILRGRERGIPRYNDFREQVRKPRLTSFEQLTTDPASARLIREVYEGDLDQVDAMVGMLAEPRKAGFGFSETAYRIFVLMAVRRMTSDRFFTDDYRPEVYTPEGLEWIERTGMHQLLLRHHPELAAGLDGSRNAFHTWRAGR
ncbi:peroxidase family protein [Kitasatospora sp. NPDC002040]|uniref:peroxidase family protein n=1 Tax=Kitasatospora sp. NPDC002040 TaxID=3154661 RepID=UPI00332BAE9F